MGRVKNRLSQYLKGGYALIVKMYGLPIAHNGNRYRNQTDSRGHPYTRLTHAVPGQRAAAYTPPRQ